MRSYDNRAPTRYSMDQITMTSTDKVRSFRGPKGKAGRLLDYGIDGISTTTAGATNTPQVSVGTAADPDAYGEEFDVGALTAPNAKSVASTYRPTDSGWATYMVNQTIPADTLVQLTCVAATGGGAAGVGNPFMLIAWDD